ncbi:N-acetylglucosamine/diacetylchitobiose ABC transporter substrate-binding protein [Streptomyces mesophilus]|uniref:N-acetylglucosamine/diacetylchitobiose ABC transporter substrate-binding protein n=1 Tax=Streptomyces mesophilus TaxID=1775132 RepID=UPI0033322152
MSRNKWPIPASRRQVLRWAGAAAVALPATGTLSGCAMGGDTDPVDKAKTGAKTKKNPFGVANEGELEVVIFKGGFGDAYATDVHKPLFEKAFPKATVKMSSTPSIEQTLQPRFVGGNPPDVVDNSGKGLDIGALIADNQVTDLTPLLDAPSVDDPSKKVRDTLVPGTVETGSFNGTPYALGYTQSVEGLWYDAALFESKGWEAPSTWDEFLAVSKELKEAGIDPIGVGGKNAISYIRSAIMTSITKAGGLDVMKNIDNLEAGAWRAPAVEEGLTLWAEYAAKYFDTSYLGQEHTVVQLRQLQGKLAFYPCADYLENEMKKDIPDIFRYAMMPVPSLTGDDKLKVNSYRGAAGEPFIIPAKAKNPAAGFEYLRRMFSKEGAAGFTKLTNTTTSLKGAGTGLELPPGAQSAAKAIAGASEIFTFQFGSWYKPLADELDDALTALLSGRAKPKQFIDRVQKKADDVKKDSSIKKFKR